MEPVTADTILQWAQKQVDSKQMPSKEVWLDIAFRLNLFKIDEAALLHKMEQAVAIKAQEVYDQQEKKNATAARMKKQTWDEYRFLQDQETKLEVIEEFVRIAKRNADNSF